MAVVSGNINKMITSLADDSGEVSYQLPIGDEQIDINALLASKLTLSYSGVINCIKCSRKSKKSFNQGYCYPCFKSLAQCDSCIVSPEKCHYHHGTCREPEWADQFCMTDHIVYLANSSGVKVGITRGNQVPTRWMDQGAIQALPIFRVATRQLAGLVEVVFKNHVADKTNWRAMLKGQVDDIDLVAERDRLINQCQPEIRALQDEHGINNIQAINDVDQLRINYPVNEFPSKVVSLNFDKQPTIEGTLQGIKGQYLILDTGVLNIRKFGGYHLQLGGEF